jgi:hypothetical protein
MDFLVILLVTSLACAYVTRCLLLVEKVSHEGPFKLNKQFVVFPSGHVQKVSLFDFVRGAFGVYTIQKRGDGNIYWVVNEDRAERWECPFCLSFWTGLVFSTLVFILVPEMRLWIVPVHFAIAAGSTIGYGLLERALSDV